MLPGRVESYDQASHTADVQPLSANVYEGEDGERVAERLPVHPSVPVVFPSGGGYRLVFPISAGDTVMLVYASRSMSEILTSSSGEEVVPADARRNHLSDPVAIPGFRVAPLKYVPTNVMSIGSDDNDAVIDIDTSATEIRAGKNATEHTLLADAWKSAFETILGDLSSLADALHTAHDPVPPGPFPDPGITAQSLALKNHLVTFRAGWSNYISTIVKVK